MTTWHRVLSASDLPEGRVTTVAAGHRSIALVHYDGQFSALDNHCPHQGGPLGEGSIENGLLRCPWHGSTTARWTARAPASTRRRAPTRWRFATARSAAVTARRLLDGLPAVSATEDQVAQLRERWAIRRAEKLSRELDDRGQGVVSAAVFAAMNRVTPEDAVIAVDVGNHAYSFGRYFEPERQTVLMSG